MSDSKYPVQYNKFADQLPDHNHLDMMHHVFLFMKASCDKYHDQIVEVLFCIWIRR